MRMRKDRFAAGFVLVLLCKRRLKIAAVGGRKPRHRGCYVSHPVWDVNSIIVSTV